MRRLATTMILALLLTACAKQQPTEPPGTATISNIKTSLTVADLTIAAAKTALPAFKLDEEDSKTAQSILSDVSKVRDIFAQRLAPYDHIDTSNAEELKQIANDALDTLQDIHDQGVDHVKNPKAKEQVDLALKAVKAVVEILLKNIKTAPAPAS